MNRLKFFLPFFLLLVPFSLSASALSDLAGRMKAGEWAALQTNNINPTLGNTGGASGITFGYTDDIVWDPGSEQLLFVGSDHFHSPGYPRFVSYSESTNTWRELPRPSWFPYLTETAMHGYDHNAIDPATGNLYHRPMTAKRIVWRYQIPISTWRTGTNLPASFIADDGSLSCCIGFEFFPEMKGLLFADGDAGIYFFGTTTGKWQMLAAGAAMGGIHNFAEYNPVHHVMICGGGNGSSDIHKVDGAGKVSTQKNAPISVGVQQTVFTVDPVGGDYLVFNNSRQFYTYNPVTDAWKQQGGTTPPIFTSSYGTPVHGVVAAPVSTHGVNLFVTCDGSSNCKVTLYKHTQGSAVESFPRPQERHAGLAAVYDLRGRRVARDLSVLPNGVYFIKFIGVGRTKKIAIHR